MGDGIDAGGGGHTSGNAADQLRIENGSGEANLLVAARHLAMRRLLRDEGVALGLASRSCGGRNPDRGQHRLLCFSVAPVVLHAAAVRQQKVDSLGAVHGAAAAEPDDELYLITLPRTRDALADMRRRRVLLHPGEHGVRNRCPLQRLQRPVDYAGLLDPGVGDHEYGAVTQLAGEFAEPVDGVAAKENFHGR